MKIPHKIMLKIERGDYLAATKYSGISRPTITKCMKSGIGSRKTVNAIIGYYESLKQIK